MVGGRRSLYSTCEGRGYCRLDLDTGEIERVAEPSNLADMTFWVSVGPDGRVIGQRALTSKDIYAWDLVYE